MPGVLVSGAFRLRKCSGQYGEQIHTLAADETAHPDSSCDSGYMERTDLLIAVLASGAAVSTLLDWMFASLRHSRD